MYGHHELPITKIKQALATLSGKTAADDAHKEVLAICVRQATELASRGERGKSAMYLQDAARIVGLPPLDLEPVWITHPNTCCCVSCGYGLI